MEFVIAGVGMAVVIVLAIWIACLRADRDYNLRQWERCSAHFEELKKTEAEWRNKALSARSAMAKAIKEFD
jgi:hypothetical protein